MIKIKLSDIIIISSKKYLKLQKADGSFMPGCNGPWKNKETPIRNTAHVALLLYKAYILTKDDRFLFSAKKACEFIMLDKNRPRGYNFLCRLDGDKINGLIGVSWALQPLIFIGTSLKIDKYLEFSKKIIKMHLFDDMTKLWHTKNINGIDGPICKTLNQQIWFGAMVLTLANALRDEQLLSQANNFFENLPKHAKYREGGLVDHTFSVGFIKKIVVFFYESLHGRFDFNSKRSWGYLPFLGYGLSLAYLHNKSASCWKNQNLKNFIKNIGLFLKTRYNNKKIIDTNPFLGAYNPIGFEIAFTLQIFSTIIPVTYSEITGWVNFQVKNYFNFSSGFMDKETSDKNTLSARLYEAVYLDDLYIY